ncbi:MAG TPA: DUF4386 domain-containing protein [Chthoniobacterales bacterium]|nr:DUF4386 domain-containing protein [Chthoniobacterales bacterium]
MQRYARVAGVLFILTVIFGYLGEAYIPGKFIVAGDAAATAHNIVNSPMLYRLGFASYLIEALCDIALAWIFYVLLRAVNREIALLSAFFGLVSTAVYAVSELFYFAALIILRNATALAAFSPDQLNALALLSLKISANCGWIFLAFYGVPSVLRGYLIFRSGYFPKFLGVLLLIAGAGFITKDFLAVLAPTYASDVLLLPMFLALLSLMVWFLFKGVNAEGWERKRHGTQRADGE